MSTPKLFKVAYARGVQHALVGAGAIRKYANEAMADLAAEVASEEVPEGLDVAGAQVPDEVTGGVAGKLVELSEAANATADAAGATAQIADEAAAEVGAADMGAMEVAAKEAVARYKLSMKGESDIGTTGGGMDNRGNHLTQAAAITAEGSVEAQKRPEGYANTPPKMEMHASAQQGQQTAHPGAPTAAYAFDHSAAGKSASVNLDGPTAAAILRKLAMGQMNASDLSGSTGGGADKGEHVTDLTDTAEGAAEAKKRPDAYANSRGAVSEPSVQQGQESAHPGSPTGLELEGKVASAFDILFRKTAGEVGHYLPGEMSNQGKVAAIRTMIGMSNPERGQYIQRLAKHAEESAKEDKAKDEKKDKKKDDDDEAKEDNFPAFLEEEKSAAMILRRLGFGQ
jgi:hypothetical protein